MDDLEQLRRAKEIRQLRFDAKFGRLIEAFFVLLFFVGFAIIGRAASYSGERWVEMVSGLVLCMPFLIRLSKKS